MYQSENNAKLNHIKLPRYINDKTGNEISRQKGIFHLIASKFSLSVKKSIGGKIANGRNERKENDLMGSLKYELNNNNNHKNAPKPMHSSVRHILQQRRAEKR